MADIKELLNASYKSQKEAQQLLDPYGFKYDPQLSSMTEKVFLDQYGNPIILHRGSKRVVDDWLKSNVPLALGLESEAPRFQKSKKLVDTLREKYPGKQITSVGHSLGGSLAEKSGADRIITFNKGAGLGDIGRSIPISQTDIKTKYDLPSFLSNYQTGGQKIELEGSMNPYTTHLISGNLPENVLFV
jgi:hypothetical protein